MMDSSPRFVYDWSFVSAECVARVLFLPIVIISLHFGLDGFIRRVPSTEWEQYSFPYIENQVFPESLATLILAMMAIFALGCGILFLKYLAKWKWRQIGEESFVFILGISLSAELTYLVCDITKKMVGRPRPDYLSRCFHGKTTEQWMSENGWTSYNDIPTVPKCNPVINSISKRALEDGRMSFPSAHTAMSFCLIGFCSLWIYSKMCMIRNTGSWRLLIPTSYLMVALIIAITRTSDYRHHPSDVWAGAALGIFITYVSFIFYFPLKIRPLTETVYKLRRKYNRPCKISYKDPAKVYKDYLSPVDDDDDSNQDEDSKIINVRTRPRTTSDQD